MYIGHSLDKDLVKQVKRKVEDKIIKPGLDSRASAATKPKI